MNRPLGRRPGPGSTRPQILAAAREVVADVGVERASMREIARRAEVDPATIYRFFDGKDDLLATALQPPDEVALVADRLAAEDDAARAMLGGVFDVWERPESRQHLAALMRAAFTNEQAAAMLREVFTSRIVTMVEEASNDDDPTLRASLAASQVVGLILLREMLQLDVLANADPERLIELVAPTIDRYLHGDL